MDDAAFMAGCQCGKKCDSLLCTCAQESHLETFAYKDQVVQLQPHSGIYECHS